MDLCPSSTRSCVVQWIVPDKGTSKPRYKFRCCQKNKKKMVTQFFQTIHKWRGRESDMPGITAAALAL